MAVSKDTLQINSLADLKNHPIGVDTTVFVVYKNTLGDNLGGFYRWDNSSTMSEDVYMNFVSSNASPTGRWVRVFQRARILPHGILVNNGGVKTFYAAGNTNASGEISLNLTLENTPTGTPIFSEIWFNDSKSTQPATSAANTVNSYVKSLSADLKTTTHAYYRPNALTITLGLLYNPFTSVGQGVPIQFKIEGI